MSFTRMDQGKLEDWMRNEKACVFTDGWDQTSFDPDYQTLPLSHFEPMIERLFASPRREMALTA